MFFKNTSLEVFCEDCGKAINSPQDIIMAEDKSIICAKCDKKEKQQEKSGIQWFEYEKQR